MRFRRKALLLFQFAILLTVSSFLMWLIQVHKLDLFVERDFGGMKRPITKTRTVETTPSETCPSEPINDATVDWTVNEIYDQLNFTLDENLQYKVPKYEKKRNKIFVHEKKEKPVTVIVVPHSHNDPGWLWTLDMYFEMRTKSILTSAVQKLRQRQDMKFIWSDTIFLQMWWDKQNEQTRSQFRDLVRSGRLEILTGGWVSSDEATTHYYSVIDQLVEGHMWVKQNLGIIPDSGWPIDPFGYSTTMSHLLKKAGINNLVILRVHGAVKAFMGQRHLLRFKWRQPWDSKGLYDVMTHVEPYKLYNIYTSCGPNETVCGSMDFLHNPPLPASETQPVPLARGSRLSATSFSHWASLIAEQLKKKASLYAHNVILLPHGDDFRYIMTSEWDNQYNSLKKLMNYFNEHKELNINMKFGTPKDYFDSLKNSTEMGQVNVYEDVPTLSGDFFVYSDDRGDYWSGYFTTRPFDKRLGRELLEVLRASEMMLALAVARSVQLNYDFPDIKKVMSTLQSGRRTHALFQHHDAITGTSTANTVIDYEKRLNDAFKGLYSVLAQTVDILMSNPSNTLAPVLQRINYNDMTRKSVLRVSTSKIQVVLVNALTKARHEVISLLVDTQIISVQDSNLRMTRCQVNPYWNIANNNNKTFEVFFEINLPPLSISVFTLFKPDKGQKSCSVGEHKTPGSTEGNEIILKSSFLKVHFSGKDGTMTKICDIQSCTIVNQDWLQYQTKGSNAYVFKPVGTAKTVLSALPEIRIHRGELLSQIHLRHPQFDQTATLYNIPGIVGKAVHIENTAKLNSKHRDTELIMRFATNIENKDMRFFTDANAFQMTARKTRKNYPVEANYFPMTSMFALENSKKRFTIHAAQPLGVAALETGWLEVMLDRVPTDKGKGLDEGVADNKHTTSKFILQIEHRKQAHSETKVKIDVLYPSVEAVILNDLLQLPVQAFFSDQELLNSKETFEYLNYNLPCDIIIANIKNIIAESSDSFSGTGLTLHKRAISCDFITLDTAPICHSQESQQIPIGQLFKGVEPISVQKTSLSFLHEYGFLGSNAALVEMSPMELLTFRLSWEKPK